MKKLTAKEAMEQHHVAIIYEKLECRDGRHYYSGALFYRSVHTAFKRDGKVMLAVRTINWEN